MRCLPLTLLLLVLGLAPALASADVLPCRQHETAGGRPRIGLVLGGGGARGFAQISVLKELERLHVPVDCIAGTSVGALVGGLYASGMPAADIETLVGLVDWGKALDDSLARPERSFRRKRDDDLALLSAKPGISSSGVKLAPGLLAGENIQLLLERVTQPVARIESFDHLPIAFRAVATDINTGKAVVIDHGNLGEAMRASMSIPGVFRPVNLDGKVLVDGGIANQLPVDVARAMGADIIIAVDVGTPLANLDEGASVLAFAEQVTGLMTVQNTEKAIATLGPRDVLIQPAFGDAVHTADFKKLAEALAIGNTALAPVDARLSALAAPETDYRLQLAAQTKRDLTPPVIEFVRLDNKSKYSDQLLLSRLGIAVGKPMDQIALENSILHIYGLETLDKITYDLVEENGHSGLVIRVLPHSYGPNYLETGLSLFSDFTGDFLFNFRAGVLRAPINPLGGELRASLQMGSEPRVGVDIHQPLDVSGRYFVGARASFDSPRVAEFDPHGNRTVIYQMPSSGVEAYAGREFGNYGAATVGWHRRRGEISVVAGDPSLPTVDFDTGEAWWSLTVDRLDSFVLPRNGSYASLSGLYSRRGFGADVDFDQINFDGTYARAIGAHSGFVGLRYHETTRGQAPFQSLYRLGGVTRFAGYRPNELVAPNYALAYAGYTYELGRVLNRAAILGGSVEYGKVWGQSGDDSGRRSELDASVYFGFDSWLGRFLFGYGVRENGNGTMFLELGRLR
jgi:NTE family protein